MRIVDHNPAKSRLPTPLLAVSSEHFAGTAE